MNDLTNGKKFSDPNDRVFIWYRAVRINEGVPVYSSTVMMYH